MPDACLMNHSFTDATVHRRTLCTSSLLALRTCGSYSLFC